MGTYQNTLQGAEVCVLAMMLALLNSTLNALVCMAIHSADPPYHRDGLRLPRKEEIIHLLTVTIDFFSHNQYNGYGMCEFSQICIMKGGIPPLKRKEFMP